MRHVALPLVLLGALAGCSMAPSRAIVNDITVPAEFDTGYRVVAVDEGKANRATGRDATTAPVVIVAPGKHTFTVESSKAEEAKPTPMKIDATVEAFKEYRIAKKADGALTLVEYKRYPERDRR